MALSTLANLAPELGDPARAAELFERAQSTGGGLGSTWLFRAIDRLRLVQPLHAKGDRPAAAEALEHAEQELRERPELWNSMPVLTTELARARSTSMAPRPRRACSRSSIPASPRWRLVPW